MPTTRVAGRTFRRRSSNSAGVQGAAPEPRAPTGGASARRKAGDAAIHRSTRRSRLVPVVPLVIRPSGMTNKVGDMAAPYTLVLLRHGSSEWNEKGLFTGWVDVRLSETGVKEAIRAGE